MGFEHTMHHSKFVQASIEEALKEHFSTEFATGEITTESVFGSIGCISCKAGLIAGVGTAIGVALAGGAAAVGAIAAAEVTGISTAAVEAIIGGSGTASISTIAGRLCKKMGAC